MNCKRYILLELDNELFKSFTNFCNKHNFSKSKYLRNFIKFCTTNNNGDSLITRDEIYKKKLMYQVHCYGNNLNQIAHKLNIAIKSDKLSATDLIDLKTAINSIDEIRKRSIKLEKYIHDRL